MKNGFHPASVVVFRGLQFGDLLCSIPALRALRASLPQAQIDLIGLSSARGFVARFSQYLDGFHQFPGFPGIPETDFDAEGTLAFMEHTQMAGYDLAIQMHGNGSKSNTFVQLLGAHRTAGFYPGSDGGSPDPDWFLAYPDAEPELRRHLRLVEFLGVPPQGEHLEFPVLPQERAEGAALRVRNGLKRGEFAVLHAGAGDPGRCWAPELFARVGDYLAETGLRVAVTGTPEDAATGAAVAAAMREPCLDLTGQTSIGGMGALLGECRLLITNDTSISHVAAALRTPSVVVFTSSDTERWAPLDRELHRPVRAAEGHRAAIAEAQRSLACTRPRVTIHAA